VTKNGGESWKDATPKGFPKESGVGRITPSAHQKGKARAAILNYQFGDWKPYICMTTDYGATWSLLTDRKGIPIDNPTRVVREDPEHEGVLFAGTEYGLYISLNDGETWESFQQNLPIVPIADIKIFRGDLILSIMGRLFWIMDNITPLHQLTSANLRSNDLLFQLKETYRFRYRTSDDDAPNYPVAAGQFDHLLKDSTSNEVTLEIFD
jgi:hypothetical protein